MTDGVQHPGTLDRTQRPAFRHNQAGVPTHASHRTPSAASAMAV